MLLISDNSYLLKRVIDGVISLGRVPFREGHCQSVDPQSVLDHFINVDAYCLVNHAILLIFVAHLLKLLIYAAS